MIARNFKAVGWVAAVGVAALICYMFSLRVAAERAELDRLDRQIAQVQGSIQTLNTELGTRGRVQQLQHWASNDFGFQAPTAGQFVDGEVALARLDVRDEPAVEAPVQMASAEVQEQPRAEAPIRTASVETVPAPRREPARAETAPAARLLRQASLQQVVTAPATRRVPASTERTPARTERAPARAERTAARNERSAEAARPVRTAASSTRDLSAAVRSERRTGRPN